MTDNQNHPNPPPQNPLPPPPPPTSSSSSYSRWVSGYNGSSSNSGGGQKAHHYPNPPDATNPDPATLRDQWRFAIRQYSRWYSQAWGTAILAGLSFFALGWIIKGSNPLPSFAKNQKEPNQQQPPGRDIPSPPVPPPLTSSPSDDHETPKS